MIPMRNRPKKRQHRLLLLILVCGSGLALGVVFAFRTGLLETWNLWRLSTGDANARTAAVAWLGENGSSRSIPTLVDLLRGEAAARFATGERERSATTNYIFEIGLFDFEIGVQNALVHRGVRAAPFLVVELEGEDSDLVSVVGNILVKIGAEAIPSLAAALDGSTGELSSWRIANVLAGIGDEAAPALRDALHDPEEIIQWFAASHLVQLKQANGEVLPVLIDALGLPPSRRRFEAIRLLGEMGEKAQPAIPHLEKLLGNVDVALNSDVVRALRGIETPAAAAADSMFR